MPKNIGCVLPQQNRQFQFGKQECTLKKPFPRKWEKGCIAPDFFDESADFIFLFIRVRASSTAGLAGAFGWLPALVPVLLSAS